jgi:hypothetical protein
MPEKKIHQDSSKRGGTRVSETKRHPSSHDIETSFLQIAVSGMGDGRRYTEAKGWQRDFNVRGICLN